MDGSIFISYRRETDSAFAGRLYDRLEHSFGRERVFIDVDSIAPGEDFVAVLESRVVACDVLLALIGRGWLTATDAAGQRRLDNPEDFVRIEIGAALAQGKRVIPVLSDDVTMPRAEDLPNEIKPLARRNAIRLTHDRFKDDAERLIRALERALAVAEAARQAEEAARVKGKEEVCREAEATRGAQDQERRRAEEAKQGVVEAKRRGNFAVFRDVDAPWCPEMVALPMGEFLMGSPASEEGRLDNEGPQHKVTIGYRFALGRYPATFAEYDYFCDVTKHEKPSAQGWGRGRRPVINVSWHDAQAYVEWLAMETGKPYRLPSEAEWEYACRAETTSRYAFGNAISNNDAKFSGGFFAAMFSGKTMEVGVYPANTWGLHDMHGNVWEWVEDVWHDSYQGAPTDGSAWTDAEGKNSSRFRVLRGGSWGINPRNLRSAIRLRSLPVNRYDGLGFRVARTLD